jgi:hypothetical protein
MVHVGEPRDGGEPAARRTAGPAPASAGDRTPPADDRMDEALKVVAVQLLGYRLAPHTRRARVILIGDEILSKAGGFLLGNLLTSVIAGVGTYLWMAAWGIPYPVLLGLLRCRARAGSGLAASWAPRA